MLRSAGSCARTSRRCARTNAPTRLGLTLRGHAVLLSSRLAEETSTGPDWLAQSRAERSAEPQLGLMIAWSPSEPARIGEIALVPSDGQVRTLGRGPSTAEDTEERLRWARIRPSSRVETPPLTGTGLSRRQLTVCSNGEALEISRVGRAALRVNGRSAETARVELGDRVTIDRQLVLVCVERTLAATPSDPATFPFARPDPFGMVGESPVAWALRAQIVFYARRDGHALLTGPSGAGKELVARALHDSSMRRGGHFVARNAATLPAGIIDAELFGNARNYPNAGMRERNGLVGEAHGGTLFLDEIGDLPEELQAHLLRLLDAGEYHRLGEDQAKHADVRLLGATNRGEASLKHDLAARLKLRIAVPGLNERREDLPLLARALLTRLADDDPALRQRFFEAGEARLDPELVEALLTHQFSTHHRELESLLLLAMATSSGAFIAFTPAVRERIRAARSDAPSRAEIEAVLARLDGNVSKAWRELGLSSRDALNRLLKKLGISARRADG